MNLIESQFGKVRMTVINGVEYGSVYDALDWLGIKKPRDVFRGILDRFPMLSNRVDNFKFEGRGQRKTPIADLQTLLQICGKTMKGKGIDNKAYESLANLLTSPQKTLEEIDRIHGAGTAKRTADYLDSFHQMTNELDDHITQKEKRGMMIGSVHKHNNISVGLKEKKDRDNMSQNQQNTLTAMQYIQKVKLSESEDKNWNAVNKCKDIADDVIKLIDKK